ncbi:PH domain-containing protein [Kribbella sp. NBC_00889]|uniref:PH domain-containing protein n=1 Tax=Kribbella sp. NBC_00889 TaxID=2975974 RepID=UPI003863BE40
MKQRPDESRPYRNRTNRVSGLLLQFMLAGVWILTDPLELRGPLPPGESFGPLGAALVAVSLGACAEVALAVWWYPSVEVHDDHVTIRNLLKTHRVPRSEIVAVDTNRAYTQIVTTTRRYRCAALENSLSMTIRQRFDANTAALDRNTSLSTGGSRLAATSSWRQPSRLELAVTAAWLLTAVVSAAVR